MRKWGNWIRAVRKVMEVSHTISFFCRNELLYSDPVKELLVVPASIEDEIIMLVM